MTHDYDIERPDDLYAFLRGAGLIGPGERPACRPLSGGVSNRTILVERAPGAGWVVKQALARLRVAVEWLSSPERIHREAAALRWCERLAPPGTTPRFVHDDRERHVLVMEAIPEPHENWKAMLLRGRIVAEHARQFGRWLGELHQAAALRQPEIEPEFADRSFFESLRLEPYYLFTAEQVPSARPFLHDLVTETRGIRATLTHGDYSPKNALVRPTGLVLLDFEVMHWGDPAFDVGFALAHLLSKANYFLPRLTSADSSQGATSTPAPPVASDSLPDFLAAAEVFWSAYSAATHGVAWRTAVEPRCVRHALGCLLARIRGRSPLEYLEPFHQVRQQRAVVDWLSDPPLSIGALLSGWGERLRAGG